MTGLFFNAPPNWPVPDDFEPSPDWRPDPAWGSPPAGWELWIDEHGDPIGSPSQRRAPVQAKGYWRSLLVLGAVLCFMSAGLFQTWTASDTANTVNGLYVVNVTRDGGYLTGALLTLLVGQMLLIPGLIGWGIHASGLTRSIR